MQVVFTSHSYTNKVAASNSVFNFPEVTPEQVEKWGLYDYPRVENLYVPSVLGDKNCRCFDLLNAKLGRQKEVRVWVLVYRDQPMTAFEYQKNYWKNGNKNELILGIGLQQGKVAWGNVMTWHEGDELNVAARHLIEKQIGEELNLCAIEAELYPMIVKGWSRKKFSDFDYIEVQPPFWSVILTFFLTLATSTGIGYFVVVNDIELKHFEWSDLKFWDKNRRYRYRRW